MNKTVAILLASGPFLLAACGIFGIASKVVTSWFVVFFLVFFNTYKGGRSVEPMLSDSRS